MLARYRVHAFSVATFGGFDPKTHFFAERSRKEAAHGVGLPAGGFHQFGQGRALGLFQEGDDMGALAALAPRSGLGPPRGLYPVLPARKWLWVDLALV